MSMCLGGVVIQLIWKQRRIGEGANVFGKGNSRLFKPRVFSLYRPDQVSKKAASNKAMQSQKEMVHPKGWGLEGWRVAEGIHGKGLEEGGRKKKTFEIEEEGREWLWIKKCGQKVSKQEKKGR